MLCENGAEERAPRTHWGPKMTRQELQQGSLAEMLMRIARERRDTTEDVVAASNDTSPFIRRRARTTRPPGRLFPAAPKR
jgi:hypothetical protein